MTLLGAISDTVAVAAEDGASASKSFSFSKYAIVFNAEGILPRLKPEKQEQEETAITPDGFSLVTRVSGWKISDSDAAIADSATQLTENLQLKLKKPKSFKKSEFLALLNSFFKTCVEKTGISIGSDSSDQLDTSFSLAAIGKFKFLISGELAGLLADGCIILELWELLEALIVQGLLGHFSSLNLASRLAEKNQSELLCLYIKHASDLPSSQLLSVLKYFLSPTEDSYASMIKVKKHWESQALSAIEKATQTGLPRKLLNLARQASVLLMMAYDDFLSSELCLHYLFSSSNAEGLALSSAISKLSGPEVLGLAQYFFKWLRKYESFPEARPCLSARSALGLWACESIPSLKSVVKALGLVLDEHFFFLLQNSEFYDELKAAEKVVNSLTSEANSSCPLHDLIKNLQSEMRRK